MNEWTKAQQHEKDYFTSGKNKQWKTPHSLKYWLNFLNINNPTGKGLEIGCGPNGLYNYTDTVIGVDSINYHNPNFVQATAEHLPFQLKTFDFVILCNSLDHCQNPQKVIEEVTQISNKLIVWSNTFPTIISQLISTFDKTHPHHFTIKELKELFKSFVLTTQTQKSIYSWHGKNATFKGKLKLFLASLLGVKGVCLHLEAKQ